jgi:hypothetical protein
MKNFPAYLALVVLFVTLTPIVTLGIIFSLNLMGIEVAYTWKSFLGAYLLMFFMKISSYTPRR